MSLTEDQLIFALRILGKDKFYTQGGHFPGENLEDSLYKELSNALGQMAVNLSMSTKVTYIDEEIKLQESITMDAIQNITNSVGMRIPEFYQTSNEQALDYVQTYGYLYRPFSNKSNFSAPQNYPPTKWIDVSNTADDSSVLNPAVSGYDKYIDPFLRTHLRDLYTDYDLIDKFPDLKLSGYDNRPDMIQVVINHYHPAGEFWISFGLHTIKLNHQFGDNVRTYIGVDQIKSIAKNGSVTIDGEVADWVGLYQLALLVQPEYFEYIYGLELTPEIYTKLEDLFVHFLSEIRWAEYNNEQKYRFSQVYDDFNFYLDQTGNEFIPTEKLNLIVHDLENK